MATSVKPKIRISAAAPPPPPASHDGAGKAAGATAAWAGVGDGDDHDDHGAFAGGAGTGVTGVGSEYDPGEAFEAKASLSYRCSLCLQPFATNQEVGAHAAMCFGPADPAPASAPSVAGGCSRGSCCCTALGWSPVLAAPRAPCCYWVAPASCVVFVFCVGGSGMGVGGGGGAGKEVMGPLLKHYAPCRTCALPCCLAWIDLCSVFCAGGVDSRFQLPIEPSLTPPWALSCLRV
jgi:hypothetical protein